MIEAEDIGLKVAENPKEELIENTIKGTEERILQTEFNLEIDNVILEYLKKQKI